MRICRSRLPVTQQAAKLLPRLLVFVPKTKSELKCRSVKARVHGEHSFALPPLDFGKSLRPCGTYQTIDGGASPYVVFVAAAEGPHGGFGRYCTVAGLVKETTWKPRIHPATYLRYCRVIDTVIDWSVALRSTTLKSGAEPGARRTRIDCTE